MSGIIGAVQTGKIQIFNLDNAALKEHAKMVQGKRREEQGKMLVGTRVLTGLGQAKFGSFFSPLSTSGIPNSIMVCADGFEEDIDTKFQALNNPHGLYISGEVYYACFLQTPIIKFEKMDLDQQALDALLQKYRKYPKVPELLREHTSGALPELLWKKGYAVFICATSYQTLTKSILVGARSFGQNVGKDFCDALKINGLYRKSSQYTRR